MKNIKTTAAPAGYSSISHEFSARKKLLDPSAMLIQ